MRMTSFDLFSLLANWFTTIHIQTKWATQVLELCYVNCAMEVSRWKFLGQNTLMSLIFEKSVKIWRTPTAIEITQHTFSAIDQFYGSLVFPRYGPFKRSSLLNRDAHGHVKVFQLWPRRSWSYTKKKSQFLIKHVTRLLSEQWIIFHLPKYERITKIFHVILSELKVYFISEF